jgi:hypothetical protein
MAFVHQAQTERPPTQGTRISTFARILPPELLMPAQTPETLPQDLIERLEGYLQQELGDCDHLLRWAIVRQTPTGAWCCEGAYLARPPS